jgi:hypothetical protein
MDDWRRSVDELVPAAEMTVVKIGEVIVQKFLQELALPFEAAPAHS